MEKNHWMTTNSDDASSSITINLSDLWGGPEAIESVLLESSGY